MHVCLSDVRRVNSHGRFPGWDQGGWKHGPGGCWEVSLERCKTSKTRVHQPAEEPTGPAKRSPPHPPDGGFAERQSQREVERWKQLRSVSQQKVDGTEGMKYSSTPTSPVKPPPLLTRPLKARARVGPVLSIPQIQPGRRIRQQTRLRPPPPQLTLTRLRGYSFLSKPKKPPKT